jgi:hypothetical protein
MPRYVLDSSALIKYYHNADQKLCDMAALEGLAVINPELVP